MDSPFRDDMLTITARSAAHNGHIDVVDLLAREFHAHIGVECLVDAAQYGQDVMIDHLVEKYGVDPLALYWRLVVRSGATGRCSLRAGRLSPVPFSRQ